MIFKEFIQLATNEQIIIGEHTLNLVQASRISGSLNIPIKQSVRERTGSQLRLWIHCVNVMQLLRLFVNQVRNTFGQLFFRGSAPSGDCSERITARAREDPRVRLILLESMYECAQLGTAHDPPKCVRYATIQTRL